MNMRNAIIKQNEQLAFEPEIIQDTLITYNTFIVSGMGGSHLAADIVQGISPALNIIVHKDYGLPMQAFEQTDRLFIASSYSGNTEEALDGLDTALKNNIPSCAISIGGKLIERAETEKIAYIKMPDTGIQPRSALGFSIKALAKIMRQENLLQELTQLGRTLMPENFETKGKEFAYKIRDRVPLVYASSRNRAIAYNWKIKFNETGKIPSFTNVFPELNHNEMTGFDVTVSNALLSHNFTAILLRDKEDHPRIQKRMEILAKLYSEKSIPTYTVDFEGQNRLERIFSSLYLADWIAYYTAELYGADPNNVPMVEEFKKQMAG